MKLTSPVVVLSVVIVIIVIAGLASLGSSSSSTVSTTCDAGAPLSLVSVKLTSATFAGNPGPALDAIWNNCSNKDIIFAMKHARLNMSVVSYGNVTAVGGDIATVSGFELLKYTAPAQGQVQVTLEITGPISPNATIRNVNGTLTAMDPVTLQGISAPSTFRT